MGKGLLWGVGKGLYWGMGKGLYWGVGKGLYWGVGKGLYFSQLHTIFCNIEVSSVFTQVKGLSLSVF